MGRDRYDRYADIFEVPETAESAEVGFRVLHHMEQENFQASTTRETIRERAVRAGHADPRERGSRGRRRSR